MIECDSRSPSEGFACMKAAGHRGAHVAYSLTGRRFASWPAEPVENAPRGFERWPPSFQGAYLKGRRAFREGLPLDACPYADHRTWAGRLTWSRSFRIAWRDGWKDAEKIAAGTP